MVKNRPVNAGDVRDLDSISGSGRSYGIGNSNLFQYFCLEKQELDTTECTHTYN